MCTHVYGNTWMHSQAHIPKAEFIWTNVSRHKCSHSIRMNSWPGTLEVQPPLTQGKNSKLTERPFTPHVFSTTLLASYAYKTADIHHQGNGLPMWSQRLELLQFSVCRSPRSPIYGSSRWAGLMPASRPRLLNRENGAGQPQTASALTQTTAVEDKSSCPLALCF